MPQVSVVTKVGGEANFWFEHDLPGIISATGEVEPETYWGFDLYNVKKECPYLIKGKILVGMGFASRINGLDLGQGDF